MSGQGIGNSIRLKLITISSCTDISDFRYRGAKMFLFEALVRVSKFIKNILSCSEDIKKFRLNFNGIECTQPSKIRIYSHLDRERVLHFNERSSKYTLPPAQWPSTCLQECVIFDSNSSCISSGHFF